MQKKVAIFDIDKTIIKTDSMLQFIWYGIKKKPLTGLNLPAIAVRTALYKLRLLGVEKAKASYFYAIRFMDEADLEHFYDSALEPNLYREALQELKSKKENGYHVLLVSASPHAYVKYFKKLPYVDEVIGTELVRRNGRYRSAIEGCNCKGEEKVARIRRFLEDAGFQIDFEHSCAYSDSLTDLPMFGLVKNRFLINRKSPGLEELRWKS